MTIGERISHFRNTLNISQEQLAEEISVSRQAVSKWEMDQALPGVDKVLQLSRLFNISTDELLCSENGSAGAANRKKYFGTDGFRGEANVGLTSMQAYKVGRFLGWYFANDPAQKNKSNYRPRIVIGKDTRRSSYMIEYSIVAGITASGADAYLLHVTTTPSVSYVTRQDDFDCGIMITASHNPYYDNGIKVINSRGEKLDDKTVALIESYLNGDLESLGISGDDLPLARKDKIGYIVDYVAGRNRYVGYLISLASHSYKNLKIGLDCANGASWMIAKNVFEALGAQVFIIGADPNGLNVNKSCGATSPKKLAELVRENHLDVGFAFDGDADRCIAVDENGNIVDGDAIMYILAKRLKSRGMLNSDTVVATIMSNSGFFKSLEEIGINCVRTAVGDRYVYESMQQNDYSLGGEQSGHIILKKYATTGDGLLTAIMVTEEICDSKLTLSKLREPVNLYPQYMKNIRVKNQDAVLGDTEIADELSVVESKINGKGRALLRKSGTEPVIRIMIESETEEMCTEFADRIAQKIAERGYAVE